MICDKQVFHVYRYRDSFRSTSPNLTYYGYDSGDDVSSVYADWTVATVPLPAGGMLLLSALGGMAALRRRMESTM